MRMTKLLGVLVLATLLSSCIGSVIGVAVDTTAEVIKAPFKIAGAVIGVAVDTTGTVFRMAHAAVGGEYHDHGHHRNGHDHHRDHNGDLSDHYVYTGDDDVQQAEAAEEEDLQP